MTRRLTREQPTPDSSLTQPSVGDVLGAKYRIERELGSGGMGVVFEVSHLVMRESRFAIKWLRPLENDAEAARRFRREARIAGGIRHAHIVQVYDVNEDQSGSYMVMELLQGESLADRIARAGALPLSEACRIVLQALSGVAAAHAAGVIHRDLKPANIFLCHAADGGPSHVKVVDFGISRASSQRHGSDTTYSGDVIVGTPAYMAPEQLRAVECDARTDVYALGITLYEALTGERVISARDDVSLVVKIITGEIDPVFERARGVPIELSQLVMKAIQRSPDERFASADAFAQSLEAFLQPANVPTAALRVRESWRRWAAAAVLLCLALAVALWRAGSTERRMIAPAEERASHAAMPLESPAEESLSAPSPSATDQDERVMSSVPSAPSQPTAVEPVTKPSRSATARSKTSATRAATTKPPANTENTTQPTQRVHPEARTKPKLQLDTL